jgi:holo-[acyl-carrier protein] synthase
MTSCNILGVGNDILEIDRIRSAYEAHGKRFLSRLFTEKEQAYCLKYKDPIPHFAGRFCAKEAISKAFGTGVGQEITWQDIEIVRDKLGKPTVHLSKKLQDRWNHPTILLSISHTDQYATAVAIWIA